MNKQSFITILLTVLMSMIGAKAFAYDISDKTSGKTIYYNYINNKTELQVTYSYSPSLNNNDYSGYVRIPESFRYSGHLYYVRSIGNSAFYGCYGLKDVTIPSSVKTIGNSAFYCCNGLTSIIIPNSVTSIGYNVFEGCSRLTSVTIPNSLTSISGYAFSGCKGLTSITIPNSVTTIGTGAFYNCSGLASVTIPNSVTSIDQSAFNGCSGLTSVIIPNNVTSIGTSAFKGCSGLTSVTIRKGVTSIGGSAFEDCSGLTTVIIPNSVESIGTSVFKGCSGLTSLKVESGGKYDSRNNCNAIIETSSNTLIAGLKNTTIPNSVTSIGTSAFDGCGGLTSVTIPNSVTSIGERAFAGCSDLTSLTIPNSVTSIGQSAFNGCSGLTSVTIPNKVTSIDQSAFNGCSGLTSVTIPNSVTSIGQSAFNGCSGLTSVTIPNSVTSIGESAFEGCRGLTSVTIGSGVKDIGTGAFANCPELTDVYCSAEEVPLTSETAFEGSNIENATLHVPRGCLDAYNVIPWIYFKNIVEIEIVNAKVKLSKTKATIEKGKTMTLKATVTPETLKDKSVIWKSSNTKVATVTSAGKVKGVKAGTATITCTSKATGAKATCKVTVGYVKLDKTEATIMKDKTTTLSATVYPSSLTDKSVKWESSNNAVATVTSAGKVKGVEAGTATITCTSSSTGTKATCKVTVVCVDLNKTKAIIEKGKTMTLKATVTPETLADKSVTWKSSNTKVAKVSSAGKVKGVKAGTATITCTSNSTGAKATCKVTVGYVKLDKTEATILKDNTTTLTATVYPPSLTDKSVTWESSDAKVATVTTEGKVKGIKAGTATITCTSNATGLKATCTVAVVNGFVYLNETEAYVQKDKTLTLKATVTPGTLTDKSVTWESSDTKIATVTSAGKVTGVKYGTATITCTSVATGAKANCQVTVGNVIISMSEFSLKKSSTNMLTATVYPSSLADKSVIWKSSDTSIATVNAEGKVKGIKAGKATITCTSVATGLKGTCTVTVLSTSEARSLGGDDDGTTGIEENVVAVEPFDVYDLSGRKVLHQVTSLDGLSDGIYIVNGKKIFKKK